MQLLDAYNYCLRAVNEQPISDTSTESYLVAQLQPLIASVRRRVLLKGWQFNRIKVSFSDDANGIDIPSTYLWIQWPSVWEDTRIAYNKKVYNRELQAYETQGFDAFVIVDVDFEQIPDPFQEWIAREAAAEFELQVHGVTPAYQILRDEAHRAKQTAANTEVHSIDGAMGFSQIIGAHNV